MKIYLYLSTKILTFSLPKTVLGSFSFDEDNEAESKLINIASEDGAWYLHAMNDESIITTSGTLEKVLLVPNHYYMIKKNNINYLLYTKEAFDDSFDTFTYDENLNILIGNHDSCNICFHSELLKEKCASINIRNHHPFLTKLGDTNIYVNNNLVITPEYYLNFGDCINIYGLQIIVLNGILLMNNPMGKVKVTTSNIFKKRLVNSEKPQEREMKEVDLYTKEEYFSKAPRLRRVIEKKIINLSPPPKSEGETQMPLILTIGPMMTMGIVSLVMVINTISKITAGTTSIEQAWPQLVSSFVMMISILLWPLLTRRFNKKLKARRKKELIEKYTEYLKQKEKELQIEANLQKEILIENLISVEECLQIIKNGKMNFWDKRIEQSDFLEVRIGVGNELLEVAVNYPEEGFTIEEDVLRKQADELVLKYKYIENVPIGYSLSKNKITALMGQPYKCYGLIHNIILQLITFYSYEDIKLVIFTNEEKEQKWDYMKYLNHTFFNDRSVRLFASDGESAKRLGDILNVEIQNRMQLVAEGATLLKPHYIVIVDDYDSIKRHSFMKLLTELDTNLGFSMVILENSLSRLPSKCNNFIRLDESVAGVLRNSFEQQEQILFHDEINDTIDMMNLVKKLSNIPIEFQEGSEDLPDAITFLEMEKVGKVEQLNILNRWNSNDATTSLKTEIGVDEEGELMYLDLHEKKHGPHGLIAGMTGSGKSEFIITYILSMAMNYSPDDVSFILIDYKGGGLAFAFENKKTGVTLPHLAGTITNLDKAEMNRTLVSIDSEIKRRQQKFNEARDALGESTMDIYKYQRYFKEGKQEEPIPHLFIICDEFAELKSQQPDFMDNLISVARIGRSLGVHLILATQKPTGVVNDQIWSNSKFRVCLKVQDESDSKELLKRPDAASLKQTGRFYLQVGYDEYFALGQSAWCGAKYYPQETMIKKHDKSVNIIDDTGDILKSIQASPMMKIEPEGEQLTAIMNDIIKVANLTKKRVKRLWLNDIEPNILINDLIKKYSLTPTAYDVVAIIGEYDAPEHQEQGLLSYSYKKDGNTLVFSNDEVEREKFLSTIIYTTCINHSSQEINIYIVDYGSESLRMFQNFPQLGGMVFMEEEDKLKNLLKMMAEKLQNRKKLVSNYGGSIEIYNEHQSVKLPEILLIFNNYEAISETHNNIYEELSSIGRDSERYGINLMITCSTPGVLGRRLRQCFENKYAFHLTDPADYYNIFNIGIKNRPRDVLGRGLVEKDGIHEFQVASILPEENNINEYIEMVTQKIKEVDPNRAPAIPELPEKVTFDLIKEEISTLQKIPIGILRDSLKVMKYDFTQNIATTIASNKLININSFMDSLLTIFEKLPNLTTVFFDLTKNLPHAKEKNIKYIDSNFLEAMDQMLDLENKKIASTSRVIYIFYGIERLKTKLEDMTKVENLFTLIKKKESSNIIFCDSSKNLKTLDYDSWYTKYKTNTEGIWIGRGFIDQQSFRISKITKEMSVNYKNNYGYCVQEGSAELIKLIEFGTYLEEELDEE